MSATCVPWYMLRSNMGLSKHGDPVFPHFCHLNQTLARVRTSGGGGGGGLPLAVPFPRSPHHHPRANAPSGQLLGWVVGGDVREGRGGVRVQV